MLAVERGSRFVKMMMLFVDELGRDLRQMKLKNYDESEDKIHDTHHPTDSSRWSCWRETEEN